MRFFCFYRDRGFVFRVHLCIVPVIYFDVLLAVGQYARLNAAIPAGYASFMHDESLFGGAGMSR